MKQSSNQKVSPLSALLFLPAGSLVGCDFEAGVGHPTEAKADGELAGYWMAGPAELDGKKEVWVIQATADKEEKNLRR